MVSDEAWPEFQLACHLETRDGTIIIGGMNSFSILFSLGVYKDFIPNTFTLGVKVFVYPFFHMESMPGICLCEAVCFCVFWVLGTSIFDCTYRLTHGVVSSINIIR